ncbi:MAG: Trep_Strep domain-containing protein [Clostridiales bacterium]|nr:Trep_Strep domain-containing protein [Clostridiales bacterium]
MKISKSKMLVGILSIAILVVSLVVMFCDIFIPINFWVHPVLNFLFCLFTGFGIVAIVLAFINKSSWYFFICAILLGFALLYALINYIEWWIAIIVAVVFAIIISLLSFITSSNKTESIALNASPDYKNYEQRKAEEQSVKEETEELPEIKSFK